MSTTVTRTYCSALLATVFFIPLTMAPVALAQDAEADDDSIVVTARRREERLLDVPMAVTAYSGDALELSGASDITALNETTPNVTLEYSRATNSTLSAFIRGVGQQDPVAGFEPGVGIYLDDVYLNRPQAAVLDIYEVERIEILRGPQGTLYGRNTIGGAVKYITKRLNAEKPEFSAKVSVGSYSQLDGILTGSMPLGETFRVGGSVARLSHSGYGQNFTTGQDNYNKSVWAGRASAEFEPGNGWFFRLTGDIMDDQSNAKHGHRLLVGGFSGAPVLDNVFDTRAGITVVDQYVDAKGLSFLGEWEANENWKFRNIVAWRDDNTLSPIDFDSLPNEDLEAPFKVNNEQFSEEFQVLYSSDKLSGVAGFYYLDAQTFNVFDVLLAQLGGLIGLPGLQAQTLGDVSTETWSVFADFTYDISDQFSLTLGGRYTDDQRTAQVLRTTFLFGYSPTFGGNGVPIAVTSNFNGTNSWTDFSPHISVAWKPNDDNNIYASFSQGFKGGGFDPRAQTSGTPDFNGDGTVSQSEIFQFMSFDPEEVNSYEIGWKTQRGAYSHSIAAFYSDYKDVQVPGSVGLDTDGDGINDSFTGITSNAGAIDIKGIEYEGRWAMAEDYFRSGDQLTLQWSLGLLDGEYKQFIDAFGVDISSIAQVQNTPDTTAAATFTYVTPARQGDLTWQNTVSYRSDSQQFELASPIDQEGYALWNSSLVWAGDDGHWQFGVHAKNITDERYKVAGYDFVTNTSLGLEGNLTAFFGAPRTITATMTWRH
jgi:iron complex outermembrane receptor protein